MLLPQHCWLLDRVGCNSLQLFWTDTVQELSSVPLQDHFGHRTELDWLVGVKFKAHSCYWIELQVLCSTVIFQQLDTVINCCYSCLIFLQLIDQLECGKRILGKSIVFWRGWNFNYFSMLTDVTGYVLKVYAIICAVLLYFMSEYDVYALLCDRLRCSLLINWNVVVWHSS